MTLDKLDTRYPAALVTGGARRIGAAITRTLHQAGFNLILHYGHSQQEAAQLACQLNTQRANSCITVQANLARHDDIIQLADVAKQSSSRLSLLVNNASTFFPTPLGSIEPEHWQQLFASNAFAPLFLSQALNDILAKNEGSIINIVDIYAERPLPNHSVYCMAKAALAAMTRSLALDMAPRVRVNGVAPGAILWPENDSGNHDTILKRIPLKRTGGVEPIAETVRWLAMDNNYITGQILAVDGGRSLMM